MTDKNKHFVWLSYAGTLFLVVLCILAFVIIGFINKQKNRDTLNTITVSGNAEVFAHPDIARFSFTLQETAKTTAEAQEVISEKVDLILDELAEIGIYEKDIATQSYLMSPKYEWGTHLRVEQVGIDGTTFYPDTGRRQVLVGYDVSQNISLKIRDFDTLPAVLTLLGGTGVHNLYGPNFEVEDTDGLEQEARSMAIQNAQAEARQLAKDLGVRLGDLVSFNEGGYYPYAVRSQAYDGMALAGGATEKAAPSLPTGEQTISSQVSLTYQLK